MKEIVKKSLPFTAALLMVVALAGCAKQKSEPDWSELKQAQRIELQPDIQMTLSADGEELSFTVTNQGQKNLHHGNGGTVSFQTFSDGTWYVIPMRPNHGATAEEYTLEPEQSYTSPFYRDSYANALPNGDYRIVFDYFDDAFQSAGCSVSEFSVKDGNYIIG